MTAKRARESSANSSGSASSTTWRTVASFLLFIHLFVVASAILASATGAPIWVRIVNGVPGLRLYVQGLDMNWPYTYHLTWSRSVDADHTIEVDLTNPTTGQVETRRFPDEQTWLGIRRRRYRMLAYQVANDAELAASNDVTSTLQSLIPQAVGGRVMRQADVGDARLRCVVHLPLRPAEVGGDAAPPRDPDDQSLHRTVYDARLWRDENGVVGLLPLTTNEPTAPGVR